MPFQLATNTMAYLKAGGLGENKSGKTHTSALIMMGLWDELLAKKLITRDQPIFMNDTETGSSWLVPMFENRIDCPPGPPIRLMVDKTKSFKSLLENMDEVEKCNGIMLIDSITHYWREIVAEYQAKKKKNKHIMTLQDWGVVKGLWSDFTDRYVNHAAHYIMLGRQGYIYEQEENEQGKKEFVKSGIKMKAEGETGYEPSLLFAMERHQELGPDGRVASMWREAFIMGDRSRRIDGKTFANPTYKDFKPHIDFLNLGGTHVGVDMSRNSSSLIPEIETPDYSHKNESTQCDIICEEIKGLMLKHFPSKSGSDHKAKQELLGKHFNTFSWLNVERMGLMELKHGFNRMHHQLEGVPVYPDLPLEGEHKSGLEDQAEKTF